MFDVKQLLMRQEQWQLARAKLSWPEKVRMAEAVRAAVLQLWTSTVRHRPDNRTGYEFRNSGDTQLDSK